VKRAAGIFACLLLAACKGAQSALDPASEQAAHIDGMWRLLLWVCGIMYALVLAFLAWALWRARRRLAGPPIADSAESGAELRMRRALASWTALVVGGLILLSFGSFLVDRSLALAQSRDAVHIKITGAQWWWRVEYQDPTTSQQVVTANELHLPVGRPALIDLSAEDVIHSFWVPNLAGKQDLIPGRLNNILLNPTRTGFFRGQCAEFCGLQHANMALDATVESPASFEAWRQAQLKPAVQPTTPEQVRGLGVFMGGACKACHQITGTEAAGQTGPDLTHVASRRTLAAGTRPFARKDLIDWLHDPQSMKPGNHMPQVQLSEAQVSDLAAYLESLK
jgi:cytochrome c oxidase subunit 2